MKKLVRDYIPAIATRDGSKIQTSVLSRAEFENALYEKLAEEAAETKESKGSIEELADMLVVLKALTELYGHTMGQVGEAAKIKKAYKGGFEQRILMQY